MTELRKPDSSAEAETEALGFDGKLRPYHVAVLLSLGLLVRIWLIHAYPIIFGGDSIVRLANQDRILLAYQLPLLQTAIHYLGYVSQDPLLIRYLMAVIGAVAGVGFYWMTAALVGRTTSFYTALLFVTNPFLLAFSVVPYQEILMLAGLFFAFYFFFRENWAAASLFLGLACLTRYEAWAACPVFVLAYGFRHNRRLAEFGRAVLLFGWAPGTWLLYNTGLAPGGTFVADLRIPAERLWRWVYLGWITVKNTPIPVLILAALGSWRFWKQGMWRIPRYRMLCGFLGLFLVAILFSAHGEREQPDRFVTAREAHILITAVIVVAGLGLARLQRFQAQLAVLSMGLGLFMADRFVARETAQPRLQLSYRLALYLDDHLGENDTAVVLARPVPKNLLERFLDTATDRGGSPARTKALRQLAQLDASPPDYQRTLVHSRLGRDRLRSLSTLPLSGNDQEAFLAATAQHSGSQEPTPTPAWLALWSDFIATNLAESSLLDSIAGKQPLDKLEKESLSIRIYKLN